MSEVVSIPQLRFPEFRDEWRVDKFVDLCKFQQGVQVDVELQSTEPKNNFLRFLRIENYTQKSNDFRYIPKELSSNKSITENEIAIVRYGATAGYIGRGLKGVLANNLFKLVLNKDTLDTDYLFHLLRSYKTFCFFQSEMSGGAMPALSFGIVGALKLPYSSISEQQKIAAFLTAVDTKIEQLSKKKELLGEYKKGLMQKIFSQAIRFKADDGSDFPDWEDGLLNTLIDNSRKIRYGIVQPGKYDKNGKYLIRGKDYSNGWEIPSEFFKVSDAIEKKYSKTRVKKGDVIVCIVGSVGNVMVIPGWLDGANITQTTARIAPDKNKLNNQYLYFYFQSLVGRNMIHKHTRVGTRPGLNIEDVEKFSILLPSLLEQAKIANFLSSIDNKIEQVGKQLDESKQFKKALLQQMFV